MPPRTVKSLTVGLFSDGDSTHRPSGISYQQIDPQVYLQRLASKWMAEYRGGALPGEFGKRRLLDFLVCISLKRFHSEAFCFSANLVICLSIMLSPMCFFLLFCLTGYSYISTRRLEDIIDTATILICT